MALDLFKLRIPAKADVFNNRPHGYILSFVLRKNGYGLSVERDVLNLVHDGFLV